MTSTPRTIGTTVDIGTIKSDPNRISFMVFNKHASAIVYMKEGSEVSADNGIPIYPKGNVGLVLIEDGKSVQEQWSFISDTATTPIVIFEGRE